MIKNYQNTVREINEKAGLKLNIKKNKGDNKLDFRNSNWKMITSKLYITSISRGQLFVTMQIARKNFGKSQPWIAVPWLGWQK